MKKECENNNYELLVSNISNRKIFCEKLGILEEYHSLYYINQVNSLKIPNYNHFLKKNPKFLSTKFINKKYNNYIKKYLDYNDAQIVGKISYDKKFVNSEIEDENLGLVIYGQINAEKKARNKKYSLKRKINNVNKIIEDNKDIDKNKDQINKEIMIFKSKDFNGIYERLKDSNKKEIKELNEFNSNLKKGHILLINLNNSSLLGKKRNPEHLFTKKIIK